MTVEHSDGEVVQGAHHAAQQLIFTATQLVEVIARMRQAAEIRRGEAERVAADRKQAADLAADAEARAAQKAAADAGRAVWEPANTAAWREAAAPPDLLTAWAAATTWAGHDPRAAAAMLRVEDEMRDRWPNVIDRYDRLRVEDGLHPASALKIALTEAANAGWDPTRNPAAYPRPAASAPPPAVTATAGQQERPPVTITQTGRPAAAEPRVWADNAAARVLRWLPPAGAPTTAGDSAPTAAPVGQPPHRTNRPSQPTARAPHRSR